MAIIMDKTAEELQAEDRLEEAKKDMAKAYYHNLSRKMDTILKKLNLKEKDIETRCKQSGFRITGGAISNIFNSNPEKKGYHSITLINFVQVCKALGVDPGDVLSQEKQVSLQMEAASLTKRSHLIFDTEDDAYSGYLGTYHGYFFPTISGESKLLHGLLSLVPSPLKDSCIAEFVLETNKCYPNGDPITKKYTGELIISDRLDSCFCLLHNATIGEICFINFHHMNINNEELKCRVALVVTTSAGDNRRPCMHRMLLSRDLISEADLALIQSQLLLNTSDIIISENNLNKLQHEHELPKEVLSLLQHFSPKESYYKLSEYQIRGLDLTLEEEVRAICLLRNYSIARKYNKIGTESDKIVFQYLSNRPKPDKVESDEKTVNAT